MFRQILLNLVVNALHAMPDGGDLVIHVSSVVRAGAQFAQIVVQDTGTGISEEHFGRIFDPFFSTKAAGTGLGLALVRRHVEAHRGEVTAETKPGRGTTFTVLLPRCPEQHGSR